MKRVFWIAVKPVAVVLVILVQCLLLPSAVAEVDSVVAERILKQLKMGRADLPYGAVENSPIPGIYKVQVMQGPTLFVSADGSHFIAGEMFSVAHGQFVNLQEQDRIQMRVELLAKIDKSEQIIFSPEGEIKAFINVFTDIDCGYCQKLHQQMPAINALGIEVRYLAFPRAGLKSASFDKIATAWCADDPKDALTRLKNREPMAINVCEGNPVEKHLMLGNQIGVSGTPALVLADGRLIPGYRNADDLAKLLGLQ